MNHDKVPYEPIKISWNVSQGLCCCCQHLGFNSHSLSQCLKLTKTLMWLFYFFCHVGNFQLQGDGFKKKMQPRMSPENQWLGSMAFPIEVVSFWGVVSEKSPRKGKWTNLYGSFLKWWVSPATPCVFLLKTISTWGGDWGETHHWRKHPYKSIQTLIFDW